MSTYYYLPGSSIDKSVVHPYHHQSGLKVQPSVEGWFVFDEKDPYSYPEYTPSTDLTKHVILVSSRIMVKRPSFLDNSLPNGRYSCDIEGIEITLEQQGWRPGRKGENNVVWHRQVLVKAPTFELMKQAVDVIRRGSITPVDHDMTLLEHCEERLRQLNSELSAAMVAMHRAEELYSELSAAQEIERELRARLFRSQCKVEELDQIKASTWHRLGKSLFKPWNSMRTWF